jgi:hypothetical protein
MTERVFKPSTMRIDTTVANLPICLLALAIRFSCLFLKKLASFSSLRRLFY